MSKGKAPRAVTPPRSRNPAYDRLADRSRQMRIDQIERLGLDEAHEYLEKNDLDGAIAVLAITANWTDRYRRGAPVRVEK